ncbi:unnamed protein product [Arctia plantaginis]|uniref:Ig-like domain-containing protein n=1 Tax=Arctia plantaginis TaxID=874455 RepID=A0A8S1A5Y5_ARCPL|nr:unnamed protein product [Arctia plantaginis]
MLFFNFLCLLYLMVLSNTHTISKSIDTDDGIDDVSDTIVNLDNTNHHRIRRDRNHRNHRIREVPTRQSYVITGTDFESKTTKVADRPYTDLITFNATTTNPTYRSHKRKISGFWKRFKAKTITTNIGNAKKRQVAKSDKYKEFKDADDKEFLYYHPTNKQKKFNSFVFQRPAIVTADDELEVTVDVPLKKKHNNVKFVFTPYVMYATKLTPSMVELIDKSIHKKTTENMNSAIAKMNTQINHLKKMYGVRKSQDSNLDTTLGYPRTAEIEELLTGIKMKAIQTVVENGPSMVDIISNTVTEATFGAEHVWNKWGTPFSPFRLSTLHVDNIFQKEVDEDSGRHHVITRSVTNEPLSISNIEEMLHKEIKNIYHKMKLKVAKEPLKSKHNLTSTSTVTAPTTSTAATTTTTTIITTTTPITTTILTPATVVTANNGTPTVLPATSSNKTTTKCKTQKTKSTSQREVSQYPIKTSTKPPQHHDKFYEQEEPFSLNRLERDNTPADVNTTETEPLNTDDYNMLNLYEQMLQKVQENNIMKLIATANLPSNKNERYRLSKRNAETLTNKELKDSVRKLHQDGELLPDYEYLKTLSTPTAGEVDDKGYEMMPSTSYEDLSKKIAYEDFVNGYKHYLKFQQEKAKADNFSAMVKYQAHRHHNVDDIGKYILDKIPQLPQDPNPVNVNRLKRFFEDIDMEDQEVSTKTDDSWFRKHFYIFLDYGPPKKFHTSQVVSLKPPIADISSDPMQSSKMVTYNQSSSLSNIYYGLGSDDSTSESSTKESTPPINLDQLTKSLDSKSTTMSDSLHQELVKVSKDIESTTKPMDAATTYAADRHKRANESIGIAEDFVTKDLEERSSTPAKEMQADVTIQNKTKSGNKFGYVDVNLVPTNSISLHVNNTKQVKKSKLKDFFKKFHFKPMKSKKKDKRACTYRPPRFNPFKSLKNIIFKPSEKTPFTKPSSTRKHIKTSTKTTQKTHYNPVYDPILDRPIEKQKTTKLNKFMMDTNDVQVPMISDSSNFSISETLRTLQPVDTQSPLQGKAAALDVPSQAGKIQSVDSSSSQTVKQYLDNLPSQQEKNPSFNSLMGTSGKPSTFLLMMDDGQKSVLYVQPETVHKSTRNMKPPKRKTTTMRTVSTKMQPKYTQDLRGVFSVNVKTYRTLPSIVMKALTSIATNETLPDLNLEIAKMQFGMQPTEQNLRANNSRGGTFFVKSDTNLVKPMLDGLSYTNQLTRIAKLSLPKTKRLEVRQNVQSNIDIPIPHDYHMSDEYTEEPVGKHEFEDRLNPIRTDKNFKNIDYFNDLLMWNNDILNIDKVPQAEWRNLVKDVEKDFGTTEYTTPNLFTMMGELKELDRTFKNPKNQVHPIAQPTRDNNMEGHNYNDGMVRHVVLNDKALVKSKDLLIKGEQKYFQYNRPSIGSSFQDLPPASTMQLPSWSENEPFKPTMNAWTADANFTVKSPITWFDEKSKMPPPSCKPKVFTPESHIQWTSAKKSNAEKTWTVHSPITWTCEGHETRPPEDCLGKLARKFYIGSKRPEIYRLFNYDPSRGNPRPAKVAKSAKSDLLGISRKTDKSEKDAKVDKSAKTDRLTGLRKDSAKDTPALMVDTTLLSYDDEVETVTNGIDVKKMSRNSQKTAKLSKGKSKATTHTALGKVVAKTNKRPQMYYSTPLPMKPSDFNKFLKEQGMDVESLISPIYGQTRLYHSWSSRSKPATMSLVKNSHSPIYPPNSSPITKLTSFFSKYSTRIDKFRHKPKDHNKINNKKENLTLTAKSMDKMKKKLRIGPNPSLGSNRYEREISYGLDRPYPMQDLNPYKRLKKLKLFRQKYEMETLPAPKAGPEETFSPELQAKLSHLQEMKRINVPKTKPKSGPQVDTKFLPTFEPHFVPTSDKKLEMEKEYTLITKTATTERTTLVSTVEPEEEDSVSDTPLKLSGSIIFTSEDPLNKDVDITIINFDDINKQASDMPAVAVRLPQKDESLDAGFVNSESLDHGITKPKMDAKTDRLESLSSKTIKLNDKYDTIDSSYRLTTKAQKNENEMPPGRLLLSKKLKATAKGTRGTTYTTYANMRSDSTEPTYVTDADHHNVLNYLEKLRKDHAMLSPKRVQISSHHYRYDISYKNPENQKSKVPTRNQQHKQRISSMQAVAPTKWKRSSLRMKNNYITSRDDSAQKKSRHGDKYANRRWVTIDSRFRYGRNLDVTEYPYQGSDKEWDKNMEKEYADIKNLEKRFFGWSPKMQFIQDKLSLKRMTASPKTTHQKTKAAKANTKENVTPKLEMTTSEVMPSLDDLYKPKNENETKKLEGDKLTDSLEGFRIQFGHKKISDAVQKIKAISTDDPSEKDMYQMKYGIPGKFGYVTKNNASKADDDFDILPGLPGGQGDNEKDDEDRDITFKFSSGADTTHAAPKYTQAEMDYQYMIQDPDHASKAAADQAASRKFEQSIFDKSMYGKKTFDEDVFEKAIFGQPKSLVTDTTKTTKAYSHLLTDIMSYDITPDHDKDKNIDYGEPLSLPDHINVDNPATMDPTPTNSNVTKKKNYIFDTASILYNKSYLQGFNTPPTKMLLYEASEKRDKTTEKPWLPVAGNTLSVLFRNPLEGHLGFGVKPIIQVNHPKQGGGVTLQVTPVPTPMEIMQARLSQNSMGPRWPQGPPFQGNWPQIQAASLGFPPFQNDFRYNSSEAYGIYMEPGILNYDYNQPVAPFGHQKLYADQEKGRSQKKNAKQFLSTHFNNNLSKKIKKTYFTLKHSKDPKNLNPTTCKNPYSVYIKALNKNKKPISIPKSTAMQKHHTVTIQTVTTRTLPQKTLHFVKRDLHTQDTYTAKDVAALEVIVDLMKNTLGYEEKDIGSLIATSVNHPMKSIHLPHDSTNSIQVHIAIPYDMQNTKKRSPLEPVRVRKVFSAKMSSPVDLEYQVHSFEGGSFETPTPTAPSDDGLSPGMYLLIDKPKNGYALKPVKTNIDFAELKSRQAGNLPAMELKGETTLRQDSIKNLAKVTLSKNFISAVNRQLVEMYENLTKTNESQLRKRRHTTQITKMMSQVVTERIQGVDKSFRVRRVIDWDAVKKFFGYERVCNCKCKANQPMCRACAASDAVIEELTFEFDNLGKFMKDHCTEIQTYFWVNPSGGLKLRNAVERIDESLRDYFKRSKGKCQGRTCEALGKQIEKRQFMKNTKVPRGSVIENLLKDLIDVTNDVNEITAMNTCYNDKLQIEGKKMIENINSCISQKAFGKRSDAEGTKKKFVKNVYSLDNINVNIICNPEISSTTDSYETSTMHTVATAASQKLQEHTLIPDNFFDFEVDNLKNNSKRKGFKRLFLKRNNKKDKLFTYYTVEDAKTPRIPFKREAKNQIEMPLVADSGGTFWLECLRASTTNQPEITKDPKTQNEPKLDVAVVQTNDIFSNNNENSANVKTMSVRHDSVSASPIMAISRGKNEEATMDNMPENLNELLNIFENFLETKKNNNQNFSVFSEKLESKQTAKIKSVRPSTPKVYVVSSKKTSKTAVTSIDKTKKIVDAHSTRPLHTTLPGKTTPIKPKTTKNKSVNKYMDIIPKDKTTLTSSTTTTPIPNKSSDAPSKADVTWEIKPSNLSSDAGLNTNVSSTTKTTPSKGNIDTETTTGANNITLTDSMSSDVNVTETTFTEPLITEKLPTDDLTQKKTTGELTQKKTTDNIFSDTLPLDFNSTDESVDSSSQAVFNDVSSDIVPSDPIFQDDVSQDDKPNIPEDNLLENNPLPTSSPDIFTDSQGDTVTKITNMLYSIKDIVKQSYATKFKVNLIDPKSVPTPVKKIYKSKQFIKVEKKRLNAPARILNKNYLSTAGLKQTSSYTDTDSLKNNPIKEPNEINQRLTTVSKETIAETPNTIVAIVQNTQATDAAKSELLKRISSKTDFLDLTSNFYLLKNTDPVLGHSNFNIDQISTVPMDSTMSSIEFADFNSQSTYGHPKIIIINEYDQVADSSLNQNEGSSNKYKNLLLSIIQYETNRLNDEWQKIAYANENSYGNKRSATLNDGSSGPSTFRSIIEDSVAETPELPKKKGLLNKLVSKIGMKVVSAKKKVAHTSTSHCSESKALMITMINVPRTEKPTAASSEQEHEVTSIKPMNITVRQKQKKAFKTPEASHLYPSSRTICDIQATYDHVTRRRQELTATAFDAYVKDIPCYKYKRLQRSFLTTRKTKIPKWDWIRNKRSVLRFDKCKKSDNVNQYCDKFEMFVKDGDGIYRIIERRKRDTGRSIKKQLRRLPPLKPGKNELYVMVGDSVSLDCPLQPQRSTYSQYIWGADPKELLSCDNVRINGFTLVIKKVGPRNAGRYRCSVDGIVRRSTKVTVVALPTIDVVFLPTYKTPRDCNYDDLKAIQQLGREMTNAVGCGNICTIRIDEPMCQKDRATNRSLIRSTGVLTMSPRRFQCGVQCRRDLFSSMLRLAIGNIPAVTYTRVVVSKDGVNETLKPCKYTGRPMTTHTLRKKDSSGHFEYHKFSSVAESGQMNIVTLCHPGFYLLKDQNICAPCPANTSSSLGDNVCTVCVAGTAAPPGAAECHSLVKRLRRYDWWWYPSCGYVLAFGGLVCACGVCMALALVVHLGSRGIEAQCPCDRINSACLVGTGAMKPHVVAGYMHTSRPRPLSPSRVILARFYKPSLPSSRGTVVDSQETRFEMWKEKNIPPSLPDIDFDIDTS